MTFEKVDPGDLAGIVRKGNTPPKKRAKKATVDTSVRDYQTWFKLRQKFGECSNEDCIDPRLVSNGGTYRTSMVATVNEVECCRYCFLEGYPYAD